MSALGKCNTQLEIFINILLVKSNARPSVLVDQIYCNAPKILFSDKDFNAFIEEDDDLRMGMFKTENKGRADLIIYNKIYQDMFMEPDISNLPSKEVHLIRGKMLGFPHLCNDFYLNGLLLNVTFYIESVDISLVSFYGYICPENGIEDAKIQFSKFSKHIKDIWKCNLIVSMDIIRRIDEEMSEYVIRKYTI